MSETKRQKRGRPPFAPRVDLDAQAEEGAEEVVAIFEAWQGDQERFKAELLAVLARYERLSAGVAA